MNLPNILTFIRFLLVPVFGYYLFNEQYLIAVSLFTIGGITDVLDGYIARKYNMITSFGKIADPLADKLMQITALALLTYQMLIPSPVLIIVIAKELFMGTGSIVLYKSEHTVVAAYWYGKLATVIFYFAIVATIIIRMTFLNTFEFSKMLVNIFIILAVFVTLFAFFMYCMTYIKIRNDTDKVD